jgi:hypothetical protein
MARELITPMSQNDFQKFVEIFYRGTRARLTDLLWKAGPQGMCSLVQKYNRGYSISFITGKSSQEIADEVELSVKGVEHAMKELEKDGIVKNIGHLSSQPVYAIEFNVRKKD